MSHTPISSRKEVILPPIEVDFEHWEGDEQAWNLPPQRARSADLVLPPVELDWLPSPSLEIELRVQNCPSPETAYALAMELITAVCAMAPELQLQYNQERTRQEPGKVTIVLTPQVDVQDDSPLRDLVAQINAGFPDVTVKPPLPFEVGISAQLLAAA